MRVILVTFSDLLPVTVTRCLSSELEYRAIIVDDTKSAKEFIKSIGSDENFIYPYSELKNCVDNFYCDFIISVCDWNRGYSLLPQILKECGVEKNKTVHLLALNTADNFFMERALRCYKQNAANFEMFSTGMSHAEGGLLPHFFKKKLFNFGRGTQDLYFDYKIAKFVLDTAHGGGGQYSVCFNRVISILFPL